MKELGNGITVRDRQFYMGGDWKFLAMITGIDLASSTHACILVQAPSDSTQKWSISDCEFGARTIEESTTITQSRKKKYTDFNNNPSPGFYKGG